MIGHCSWHTNLVKSSFHVIWVNVVLKMFFLYCKFRLNQTKLGVVLFCFIAQTLLLIYVFHFFYFADVVL